MGLGAGLIGAGIAVLAVPLIGTWVRGNADDQALRDWNSGGSAALAGAPNAPDAVPGSSTATSPSPGAGVAAPACKPGAAPATDYALVTFPSLAQYGYSGVAGNGDWNMLHQRSMVHYTTSAAPGQQGNVIVAFHREPHYEHIDQLNVGDVVTVQDRSCTVFTYRITQRWTESPGNVSQLVATSGHDLTLITCTPWWRDYNRIVWRATLVP
ncbi:MAG TPA: class E sortase [Candidatus Angelobacter sp.]|jgi:LPXTG-site transpeptidase (sortase) family protein|nr:class E sortase [Candidatus Angelobacter sp.]